MFPLGNKTVYNTVTAIAYKSHTRLETIFKAVIEIKRGSTNRNNGWLLRARPYTCPEISPVKFCADYRKSLDQTTDRGAPSVNISMQKQEPLCQWGCKLVTVSFLSRAGEWLSHGLLSAQEVDLRNWLFISLAAYTWSCLSPAVN